MSDIVRPGELRERLGISKSRFHQLKVAGRFRHLEAPRVSAALGTRVYNRKRVDDWFDGGATLALPTARVTSLADRPARGPKSQRIDQSDLVTDLQKARA